MPLLSIISVDQLSEALGDLLNTYNREIITATKSEAKKAIDKLVRDTKATAPVGHRRSHHYKNSITSRKEMETDLGIEYLWYVKGSDYRLSHLLEHGHATRNGGRSKAYHFIQNATDPIIESYIKAIEEAIKNG